MRVLLSFQIYEMAKGTFAITKLIRWQFAIEINIEGPPIKHGFLFVLRTALIIDDIMGLFSLS